MMMTEAFHCFPQTLKPQTLPSTMFPSPYSLLYLSADTAVCSLKSMMTISPNNLKKIKYFNYVNVSLNTVDVPYNKRIVLDSSDIRIVGYSPAWGVDVSRLFHLCLWSAG